MLDDKFKKIEILKDNLSRLNNNSYNKSDAEKLVELTKELYEWSVILRYKLYEQNVYKQDNFEYPKEEIVNNYKINEYKEINEEYISPTNETLEKKIKDDTVLIELKSEEELLLRLDDEQINKNSNDFTENIKDTKEETSIETNETIFDLDIFNSNDEDKSETFENSSTSINSDQIETKKENEINHNIEIKSELNDVLSFEKQLNEEIEKDFFDTIINEIKIKNENNLMSNFINSKIEFLESSFGFNERFQYVNELFEKSNDEFNKAINKLDSFNSFSEAKELLLDYINIYEWDLESDLIKEFILKVYRRFL